MIIEGNFLRQTNKTAYVGRVTMEIIDSEKNEIDLSNVKGWGNEKVYAQWINGARVGAEYALKRTEKNYIVRIKKIIGTDSDTNPTIVGTATIFGLLDAINIKIDKLEIERLTNITLNSWSKEINEIPKYEE